MKKAKKAKPRKVVADPGKTRRAINAIIKKRDARGTERGKAK